MKKAEIILGSFALAGIILKLLNLPVSTVFILLSLIILSSFYYLLSFALLNSIRLSGIFKKESYKEIKPKRIIFAVLVGFVLSNLIIGILLKLQAYPFANVMLFIGLFSAGLVAAISMFSYIRSKSGFSKRILFRSLIIGLIGLLAHIFIP